MGRQADRLKSKGLTFEECADYLKVSIREVAECVTLYREARRVRAVPEDVGQVRGLLGMSKSRLAAELGVDRRTVARWELGVGKPKPLQWRELRRLVREMWGK